MRSTLRPSQKAILAMSRAQYLAYVCPLGDEAQAPSTLDYAGDGDGDEDNHETGPTRPAKRSAPTGKLSVGVCVFRLDGQTLQPAVLLLRRSPRWWGGRIFTSALGGQGAGKWGLPGGKVENDDFCISGAIERLVREKTGLRVTRIMAMLPDVRWRAELKVLLGEESEEARNSSDESLSEDANTMVGSGAELDWTRSIVSGESETADDGNNDGNNDVNSNGNKGDNTSGKGILAHSVSQGLEALGLRMPTDSIFWPQARNPRLGERNDYECNVDNGRDGGFEYDADHESVNDDSMYDSDETHDPSLEPAPLSLPSRNAPRRREARSSFLSSGRRHAQIFPYKIVQKEYVQLNFAVLVDEDTNEDPLPRFLLQHADGYSVGREASEADGGEDEADRGEEEVYENDELAWATWARVEQLPMDEALRRVVLEGLAWMESLTVESF